MLCMICLNGYCLFYTIVARLRSCWQSLIAPEAGQRIRAAIDGMDSPKSSVPDRWLTREAHSATCIFSSVVMIYVKCLSPVKVVPLMHEAMVL